jgi:hypothetical protein
VAPGRDIVQLPAKFLAFQILGKHLFGKLVCALTGTSQGFELAEGFLAMVMFPPICIIFSDFGDAIKAHVSSRVTAPRCPPALRFVTRPN